MRPNPQQLKELELRAWLQTEMELDTLMSWPAVLANGPSCPHPVIRPKISLDISF